MNELRMYVEHLFEGKVLTSENIELKEEIYGNLVARYEDYLAQGLSESDALTRTKASITSLDDVLADESAEKPVSTSQVSNSSEGAPAAEKSYRGVSGDDGAAATSSFNASPVPPVSAASQPVAGAPVPPGEQVASAEPRKRKVWPIVVCVLVAIFVVLPLFGMGLASCAISKVFDTAEDIVEIDKDNGTVHLDDGNGNSVDIDKDGLSLQSGDDAIYLDRDGNLRIEGDLADDLLKEVVNSEYTAVEPYVNTSLSDTASVEKFVAALPMAQWAHGVDVTQGAGVLCVDYLGVSDAYDGDSIDAALVYNMAALFAAMPEVTEIRVNESESDEPHDTEYYVFTRTDLEDAFGMKLDASTVSQEGWLALKADHLYKNDFVDHVIDRAEHWR